MSPAALIVTGYSGSMDKAKRKILLLGANGQVGWELRRALIPLGDVVAYDIPDIDFTNLDQLAKLVDQCQPNIIVNAAAYTAVDKAESHYDLVQKINATAVKLLAEKAIQYNALLVHYSTDYVFNGESKTPYKETDQPNPQSVYGVTKLQGEQYIQASGCSYLIFRTSWVYAARGANFAKTMIRLAAERDALKVVNDQIGAPTSAELIADVTSHCLLSCLSGNLSISSSISSLGSPLGGTTKTQNNQVTVSGIYNLVPTGEVSWFGFAQFVIKLAENYGVTLKLSANQLQPILTTEYPTPAQRPKNSRLDVSKIQQTFGIYLPNWRQHAQRLIEELYTEGPV